jgi:hypothetical protein
MSSEIALCLKLNRDSRQDFYIRGFVHHPDLALRIFPSPNMGQSCFVRAYSSHDHFFRN